jgi:PAS domain-containing protein
MPQRAPFARDTIIGPEQLSTLLDSVQELIAILSPDGIIQFASAGFTRVLGHAAEDLAGSVGQRSRGVWRPLPHAQQGRHLALV